MPLYAVAFADMSENELRIELITADDWLAAAKAHSHSLFTTPEQDEFLNTVAEAKTHAFDCDGYFDIIQLQVEFGYDVRRVEIPDLKV
jgi:hypothetical protein